MVQWGSARRRRNGERGGIGDHGWPSPPRALCKSQHSSLPRSLVTHSAADGGRTWLVLAAPAIRTAAADRGGDHSDTNFSSTANTQRGVVQRSRHLADCAQPRSPHSSNEAPAARL